MNSERFYQRDNDVESRSGKVDPGAADGNAGRKERRFTRTVSQRSVRLLIASVLVAGLVLAVLPPDWHEGFRIGGMPLIHIAGFAAATFGFALLLGGGSRLLPLCIGLFFYGALIEIAQTQVAWRSDKLSDLGYNAAGIAAGVAFYILIAGIRHVWRHKRTIRNSL